MTTNESINKTIELSERIEAAPTIRKTEIGGRAMNKHPPLDLTNIHISEAVNDAYSSLLAIKEMSQICCEMLCEFDQGERSGWASHGKLDALQKGIEQLANRVDDTFSNLCTDDPSETLPYGKYHIYSVRK